MNTVTVSATRYHGKAQASCAAAPYRVDEGVRGLDVAEGRVQRQTEADCVVQARLKANWSGENHVSEGTNHKQRE